jgi:hypothetical protein
MISAISRARASDVPRTLDRLLEQLRRDAAENAERRLSAEELVTKKVSLLAANVAAAARGSAADGQTHAPDSQGMSAVEWCGGFGSVSLWYTGLVHSGSAPLRSIVRKPSDKSSWEG